MHCDFSLERGVIWWTKSAAQGHAEAENCLGYAYEKGGGVAASYERALHFYQRSVAQGNAEAARNLR